MKIYCDGYILPHGGGYVVCDENKKVLARGHTGRKVTNNEVELRGILHALKIAKEGDTISSDSRCCIWWARKGYSKSRNDLRALCMEARTLLFNSGARLEWESREVNLAGHLNEEMHDKRRNAIQTAEEAKHLPAPASPPPRGNVFIPKPAVSSYYKVPRPQTVKTDTSDNVAAQNVVFGDMLHKVNAGAKKSELTLEEQICYEVMQFNKSK